MRTNAGAIWLSRVPTADFGQIRLAIVSQLRSMIQKRQNAITANFLITGKARPRVHPFVHKPFGVSEQDWDKDEDIASGTPPKK